MKKMSENKFNKLRTEFLPEALEIVEKPTAPLGSIIIWLVFILLFAFILWACIGQMDEVATARGHIIADEGVQKVQAAGTGVVTEIKVKEGDRVHKGDVLYTMEKEIEKKGIDYSEGEMGLLELRIDLVSRLLAGKRLDGFDKSKYTPEQIEVIDAMIAMEESNRLEIEEYEIAVEVAKNRQNIASQNVAGNDEKTDYLKGQKQLQNKADSYESASNVELELLQEKLEYAKGEASKYKKLYDAGAKSKSEWEKKANDVKDIEKQIDIKKIQLKNEKLEKSSQQNNIDYQIKESESQKNNMVASENESQQSYESAMKELDNVKNKQNEALFEMKRQYVDALKQYDIQIAEQYNQYENKDIVAMYDGVAKTLVVDKIGSVVTATQIVAEIIPDSNSLIVEAEVHNSDIGYIEVGQDVDIKVDTYNYQKYGKLTGTVMYISPDATENEMRQQVYKVRVLIEENGKNQLNVSQGMECTVEVKTDKRRIIEFFLEPLTDALDKGLKER